MKLSIYIVYICCYAIIVIGKKKGLKKNKQSTTFDELKNQTGWFYANKTWEILFQSFANYSITVRAVGEIGVHNGHSFVSLLANTAVTVPAIAIDTFDKYSKRNYDKSGYDHKLIGKRLQTFRSNLEIVFSLDRLKTVVILECDSMQLSVEKLLSSTGNYSITIFSIDGCHSYECTKNDLLLAMASLSSDGVIIVDDYVSKRWTGVSKAVDYLLNNRIEIVKRNNHSLRLSNGLPSNRNRDRSLCSNDFKLVAYGQNKHYIVRKHQYKKYFLIFLDICSRVTDENAYRSMISYQNTSIPQCEVNYYRDKYTVIHLLTG